MTNLAIADTASTLCSEYLQALLSGKRKSALDMIMAAHDGGYPIHGIYLDIFQETLYEVGRLWESNRITVADEHMATAITQFIMSNLYQHLEVADTQRGRLVMTGIAGELHQVGANMIADVMESDGWDVIFLGTNAPLEGVIESLRHHKADLLGISSTMAFNIPQVIELARAARREFDDSLLIMLGGGAFRDLSELPPGLKECIVANDLREALEKTHLLCRQQEN